MKTLTIPDITVDCNGYEIDPHTVGQRLQYLLESRDVEHDEIGQHADSTDVLLAVVNVCDEERPERVIADIYPELSGEPPYSDSATVRHWKADYTATLHLDWPNATSTGKHSWLVPCEVEYRTP